MSVSHPQHGDCRVLGTAAGLAAARRSRGAGGPEHPRVPLLCSAAFCPLKPGDLAWPQADLALVSLANPESQGSHCGQELRAGGTGASVLPATLPTAAAPAPARACSPPPALDTQPSIPKWGQHRSSPGHVTGNQGPSAQRATAGRGPRTGDLQTELEAGCEPAAADLRGRPHALGGPPAPRLLSLLFCSYKMGLINEISRGKLQEDVVMGS